jgi:hypothetical protein
MNGDDEKIQRRTITPPALPPASLHVFIIHAAQLIARTSNEWG